jgi:hypothetical protein
LVFQDPYVLDFLNLADTYCEDESSIRVADYMTELPPRDVLTPKLTEAMQHARETLARRELLQFPQD